MRLFADLLRCAALGLTLASLAGCSEYLRRSELISPYGGDAVNGNKVVQMVDPWPRASARREIAYDGIVMRRAVERYHSGTVIPPKGTGTSTTYELQGPSNESGPPPNSQAAAAAK
jgi:hypothetical protein